MNDKADTSGPQECPGCGIVDCGHSPQEMQGFALDALIEASQTITFLPNGDIHVR